MNLELRKGMKRKNFEDVEDEENLESDSRYSSSMSSTSVNEDSTSVNEDSTSVNEDSTSVNEDSTSVNEDSTSVNEDSTSSTDKALAISGVLTHILKYLPIRDCNNFRRVCKLWNDNCELKFVFRTFTCIQPEEIAVLLLSSDSPRMKLEFQCITLRDIPDVVWERCGPKIRTLHIHNCIIDIENIQIIISNCIHLKNLKISQKLFSGDEQLLLVPLLDYFLKREEKRTRLRSLAVVRHKPAEILQDLLEKIFTVFPCIENLSIVGFDLVSSLPSNSIIRAYDLRKLKSLTFIDNVEISNLWSENPVVPMLDYQLLRLTKFKTTLYLDDNFTDATEKERLFLFFIVQKDLEVIDLEIHIRRYKGNRSASYDDRSIFIKSLLFHVLRTCSNLRELHIRSHWPVKLTNQECEEFISLLSNLQSLKLAFCFEKNISGSPLPSLLLPNFPLRVLQLNTKEPFLFSILKLSSQLKHLALDVFSDGQLKEIIRTMPADLETLMLSLVDCTNDGLTGENEESSIKRLQKLKYLKIIDWSSKIRNEVFNEFHFPCLEYLGLRLRSIDRLPKTLLNMPVIKTLELSFEFDDFYYGYGRKMEIVIEVCKSLKNLHHLIVDKAVLRDTNSTSVVKIFDSLPNLRYITSSCWGKYTTFIFNRHTRIANSERSDNLEFIENKFLRIIY